MILVSFLVLVVAIALLVVGLVRQSAPIIWAAIGTSLLSAILLFLGNRLAGRVKAPTAPGQPEPLPQPVPPAQWAAPESVPSTPPPSPEAASQWAPSIEPTGEVTVITAAPEAEAEEEAVPAAEGEGLAIDDYEAKSVSAIVPLLSDLSYSDLVAVRDFEASHAGRKTLLARLDVMIKSATAPAPEEEVAPEPEPSVEPEPVAAEVAPPPFAEPVAEPVAEPEPEPEAEFAPSPLGEESIPIQGFAGMKAADASKALAGLDADALLTMWEFEMAQGQRKSVLNRIEALYLKSGDMPIDGYDGAAVGAVKPLLSELLPPELRAVRAHEEANANRKSILGEIDKLLARTSS